MSGRTVVVVGFGSTGRAVAARLLALGDRPVVFDDAPSTVAEQAGLTGVEVRVTPDADMLGTLMAESDLVVPSPGVPPSHPVLVAAERAGVPVRSEVELAASVTGRPSPRLVAITGTNGKTTVTTLVSAILAASGIPAISAGNIGLPLIDAFDRGAEVVVGEVSSFQLQFTEAFHPEVSCWLNLSPDHLDWHPTFEHYARAKARIWANQTAGDSAVFNADDPAVAAAAAGIPAGVTRAEFSIERPAAWSSQGGMLLSRGTPFMPVDGLPRSFPHDVANALAAAAVAVAVGASLEACAEALSSVGPLPHRVSLVAVSDGVAWYDDSKATTPASVLAAVKGFSSVVLIAGGQNKGLDLRPLASTIPPVRAVVAIGRAAAEVAAVFGGRVPLEGATSMEVAVEAAASLARPGDAVLLSPGCASFDWYPSYAARGEDFSRIVTSRIGGRT